MLHDYNGRDEIVQRKIRMKSMADNPLSCQGRMKKLGVQHRRREAPCADRQFSSNMLISRHDMLEIAEGNSLTRYYRAPADRKVLTVSCCAIGTVNQKTVSLLGSLVKPMRPPMLSTICFAMCSPNPVPSNCRVDELSA